MADLTTYQLLTWMKNAAYAARHEDPPSPKDVRFCDAVVARLEADAAAYQQVVNERDRLRVALQLIASGEDAPDLEVEGDARSGLHCGVEDRDCRDRYEGADFGYTVGVEKTLEWARNEANAALKGEA